MHIPYPVQDGPSCKIVELSSVWTSLDSSGQHPQTTTLSPPQVYSEQETICNISDHQIYQNIILVSTVWICDYSLASKTQPTPVWIAFGITALGRKDLVTLGRFLCAMSRLLHRSSNWLRSFGFELISTCETAESEDLHGEVRYPR